jgi:hypothetical protein
MAWAFVQAPSSASNTVSPVSLAYGANNSLNNLLLAIVSAQAGVPGTPTDTAGNTWVQIGTTQSYNTSDNTKLFMVAQAKAAANTVSCTYSGTRGYMGIVEFSGGSSSPLDTLGQANSVGSSTVSIGITPASAGELIVLLATEGGGGLTWTAGGTGTLAWSGAGPFTMAQYLLNAPAGVQTPAMTMSQSQLWGGFVVAFKAVSVYSQPDCRAVTSITPNSSRTVQNTVIYDVPKVDSRVTSIIPQNSRTPGTFGPGE